MDIVDAQVHAFYKHNENELLSAMNALGIGSVLIDEFWRPAEETESWPFERFSNGAVRAVSPLAQAAAFRSPDRFSFMQRLNRHDPDLEAWIATLGSTTGCRAVRILVKQKADREALGAGGFDPLLHSVRRYSLPVSVLIYGRDTADRMRQISGRFSDIQFILDHCGNPKSPEQWNDVLALGSCPNIVLKWCHAHHHFAGGAYPFPPLQSELCRAVDAFGPERIMWASDITHDRSNATWSDLLHYIRDSERLSERDKEWLLGRTARTVLRWAPPIPDQTQLASSGD